MTEENQSIREKFDSLFLQWKEAIQDPKVQFSSRPRDYIDNDPYREIVKLGRDALPFIIEKLKEGEFFLNQAVVDITSVNMAEIISEERRFASEQEKSTMLIEWWQAQQDK